MILYNLAIWVFSVLILRMVGATESGYYAIATSLGNTYYAVSLWGMRSFIVSDQNNKYSYYEYGIARFIAIIISILLVLGTCIISSYSMDVIKVLIAYSLFKFAEAMIELFECFAQQKMVMDINAKSMVLRGIVYILLFFISLKLTHHAYIAFSVITICSILICIFVNYRKLKKVLSFNHVYSKEHVLEILKKCFSIMLFELLAAAIVAIPRLFYERIGSTEALGIYVSIYTMVVFLQLVINILIYTFAPYMAKVYQEKNIKKFKQYIGIVVGGAIGLGLLAEILVYLIGHPVMSLIFGKEAGASYSYLYLGIISGVSLAMTWLISQIYVILEKHEYQLVSAFISVISCVIFSYFLVNTTDCNRMSLVLILSNLIFIASASVIMIRKFRSIL